MSGIAIACRRNGGLSVKKVLVVCAAFVVCLLAVPQVQAASIQVAQCTSALPCFSSGPTPWSYSLSLADLTAIGLGTSAPLIAAQTFPVVIRLGETTLTIITPGGPVVQTLSEFSGGTHFTCTPYCEVDIVGMFDIPLDALSGTIEGAFGNSVNVSSAGVDVCLGSGGPACTLSVPEPASVLLLTIASGLGFVGFAARRRKV